MDARHVDLQSMSCSGLVRLRLACALLLGTVMPALVHAQANEYAAKAAFIYNIALFSNLAQGNASVVRLCVLGRDPFGESLTSLEGKPLGPAKLTIVYPRSVDEVIKNCQILFISDSETDRIASLAETGKAAGVLTIADSKGAARKGIMLELSLEDKRIAFEFNAEAARTANITLSSKVLRLARAVY